MRNATRQNIGEITATRVEQAGPKGREFTYIDIGSIELDTKRIVDPKVLPVSKAPSRAKQILKSGDVLVSMTRPNRNAVALVPPELEGAIGSTGFHVLRARGVEPAFLFYAVQTNEFIDSLCEKVQGALYPAVRPRDISSFNTFLPASVTEQRQIVAEIEKQFTRLEAGVAALRRAQANLNRYRASVLKAACEGRLVPTEADLAKAGNRKTKFETGEELLARILAERRRNWQGRGQYKDLTGSTLTDLSQLPDGWVWARAEQLCELITKGTTPSADKMFAGKGEVPFIKVYNLTFTGAMNLEYKPVFISRSTHEVELTRSEVRTGDILINIVGPPLGQVSIVPASLGEANINQAIARFRVVLPECQKQLALSLMTQHIIGWALKRAKTTAGQSNLTLELCRDLPIPLPPLVEQARIVAEVERRMSVIEELEATVSTSLQRATRLRQSILQRAFSPPLTEDRDA